MKLRANGQSVDNSALWSTMNDYWSIDLSHILYIYNLFLIILYERTIDGIYVIQFLWAGSNITNFMGSSWNLNWNYVNQGAPCVPQFMLYKKFAIFSMSTNCNIGHWTGFPWQPLWSSCSKLILSSPQTD